MSIVAIFIFIFIMAILVAKEAFSLHLDNRAFRQKEKLRKKQAEARREAFTLETCTCPDIYTAGVRLLNPDCPHHGYPALFPEDSA